MSSNTSKIEFLKVNLSADQIGQLTRSNLSAIAKYLADDIRKRTRLGYGAKDSNAEKDKFSPLKDSTLKVRKKNREKLSEYTRWNKNNLTRSGQMTESIEGRALSGTSGEVFLNDSRDDGKSNNQIASYHENGTSHMKARPFMHLDSLMKNRLISQVRKAILENISKKLR